MYFVHGRLVVLIVLCGVVIVGFVCFISGIVLIVNSKQQPPVNTPSPSEYSAEGNRVGLEKILLNVRNRYFELYPSRIAAKPGVTSEEVKQKFRPYDPKPAMIKARTDGARQVMKQLQSLDVKIEKLTLYEQRALDQAKYWVGSIFPYGVPYAYDYYTGDWMLGPDLFCWTPTCISLRELESTFHYFKPKNVEDLELLKSRLKGAGLGLLTEIDNMKLGVSAGMIRNVEACKSGVETMQTLIRSVEVEGAKGILKEQFAKILTEDEFYNDLDTNEQEKWKASYGKTPKESIEEASIDFVGKPAHEYLRYIEFDHSKHCVSSDISSGYGSLPLKNVYVNSKPVNRSTGLLPDGQPIMDGKETYKKFLQYFTTTSISPDEVYALGVQSIDSLYRELLQLVKEYTGKSDNEEAKRKMIEELRKQSNYFNDGPIPPGESDSSAHSKCYSMETAKVHCPVRWQAMNKYFSYVRELSTFLTYKVLNLFHFVGRKITVPSCPVEPVANFNPAAPAASYQESNKECTTTAKYYIPFFRANIGPKMSEWSVSAHEMVPGHHLQVQGYLEYFLPKSEIQEWMSSSIYFLTFAEGWALYAEGDLIPHETDAYKTIPLVKITALRWKVLRGVRLMIEIGLHMRGMKRSEAIKILSNYTWDDKERVEKEVTRFQSVPGQAVTYSYGHGFITNIRKKAEKKLGKKFNIKDFHFHLLRNGGTSTMRFLEKAMDQYTSCELDKTKDGCHDVLNPPHTPYSEKSAQFQDWSRFRVSD